MIELIIAWYALGWATAGIVFIAVGEIDHQMLCMCIFIPPICIMVALAIMSENYQSSQYLWKR